MPALKIGVELASLRLPFKKALHMAAEWGADAVEIDLRGEIRPQQLSRTGVRQLRKTLDDYRLRVSAVSYRTRRGYDAPVELEPRIAGTKAAMELAHQLGATVVVNHVGRVPADKGSEAWRLLVDVLDELGRHGNRVGARLAAETGSESGEDLARLLAALPEGALAVDLNPGNLLVHGFSPREAVDLLGPAILHVHATDAFREPGAGRGTRAPLGEGTADYPALLGALEQHDYRGYFTVAHPTADDPIQAVATAIAYLRSV